MNLFDLFAKITLDTSEYDRELDAASEKTHSFGDKLKSGLATAAKAGAVALGAATTAVGVLTKASLEGYGSYEQLVGGVETLFKTSADVVQRYADNAYKTAGLSANQYMETVTSFSASLLQSLGGDTEAAAKYADMAVTDMSDNANKMGTAMEMIQNAYGGFAKQNFTMLDNLKLGYGGTKEEMERLLADAEKISGIKYDISSYADMVDAIHVVQTEMGITGTTAKEAADTIQGSAGSAKAAWENLVTGIGNENADLDTLIGNFVDSVSTSGKNIIPRIEQILVGIGQTVQKLAPIISEQLPPLIEAVLPSLVAAGGQLLGGVVSGIINAAPSIADAAFVLVDEFGNAMAEQIPGLSVVFENLETVVVAAAAAFVAFKAATAISGAISALQKATEGQTIAQAALNAVMNANPFVLIATLIATVVTALITLYMTNEDFRNKVNAAWESVKNTISGVVNAIVGFFTVTIPNGIRSLLTAFNNMLKSITTTIGNIKSTIINGIGAAVNWIKNLPSQALGWGRDMIDGFVRGIKEKISAVTDAVKTVANKVTSFLHFSRPDEGPLREYETWMPDFMKGLAAGIDANAWRVEDALGNLTGKMQADFSSAVPAPAAPGQDGAHSMQTAALPFPGITININGIQFSSIKELAQAVGDEVQSAVERSANIYGTPAPA